MSLTKVVITPGNYKNFNYIQMPYNSPSCVLLILVLSFAEVFLAMCTHALTTEAEEIMGLLLGDIRVRWCSCTTADAVPAGSLAAGI